MARINQNIYFSNSYNASTKSEITTGEETVGDDNT